MAALIGAVALIPACGGSSPASPSTASAPGTTTPASAPVTVSKDLLVATPVTPADGAVIDLRSSPVTFAAAVPAPPAGALVIDTFEFDQTPDFSSPTTKPVTRTGTSTTVSVTLSPANSQLNRDFYWRVRSSSGELAGDYSPVRRYRVPLESLHVPGLMTPLSGSIEPAQPRLAIEKLIHSTDPFDWSWSYDFEVAQDPEFQSMVTRARVGETVTTVVSYTLPNPLANGRYYWRARAFDNQGHASDYTAAWTFEVAAPFALAPQQLSPAPGATTAQYAVFTVRSGRVFENQTGTRTELEVSATPTFDTVAAAAVAWAYNEQPATLTVTRQLPGGSYYWRVRNVLLKSTTQPEISSAWSEARPVALTGQALGAPTTVAPINTATTALRPTFIVANVTRTQPGAIAYQFEVSTDTTFAPPLVASSTVAEGAGTTAWTVPFDLPVGLPLWWRARATDASSGTTGDYSKTAVFSAVDSRTSLYTMTLSIPASCGFTNSSPALFIQTTDAPTAGQLHFIGKVSNASSDLVVDLAVSGGSLTGTAGGFVPSNGLTYRLRDAASPTQPSSLAGTGSGAGMSGTVTGSVSESSVSTTKSCAAGVTWTIAPRTQ